MGGQPRVEDPLDLAVFLEEGCDSARVLAVAPHPQRKSLDAPEDEPAIEGAGDGAERLLEEEEALRDRRIVRRDEPADHI